MSSVLGVRDAMLQAFSLGQAAGQPSGIASPAAAGGEPAGEQSEAQQQEQPMQVDSPPPPEQGQQQPPEVKQEQQEQVQEQAAGQQALPGRAAEEGGAAGADAAAEAGNGAGEAVSLRAGTSMGGSRANGSVGGGSSSQIEEVQPASHGAINNPGGAGGFVGGAAWSGWREGAEPAAPRPRGSAACAESLVLVQNCLLRLAPPGCLPRLLCCGLPRHGPASRLLVNNIAVLLCCSPVCSGAQVGLRHDLPRRLHSLLPASAGAGPACDETAWGAS